MKPLKNLLIFFSLTPIILVVIISTLNFKEKYSLKILIWETPKTNLGKFFIIGAGIGFSHSLIFSSFINKGKTFKKNKKYISTPNKYINKQRYSDSLDPDITALSSKDEYFERDPNDPLPTISIPYRIIEKSTSSNSLSENDDIQNYEYEEESNNANATGTNQSENLYGENSSDDWNKLDDEKW